MIDLLGVEVKVCHHQKRGGLLCHFSCRLGTRINSASLSSDEETAGRSVRGEMSRVRVARTTIAPLRQIVPADVVLNAADPNKQPDALRFFQKE